MIAHLITIGNEILIGDTINTNASWLGNTLTENGINVERVITIGDSLDEIIETIRHSSQKADVIITTGGLGPTHDDITKKALCNYFDVGTKLHEPTLNYIKKIFKKRNIPFSDSNYDQALVPENCEVMFNKWGTAPGMWFNHGTTSIAVLPGVPHEMKELTLQGILPRVRKKMGDTGYYYVHYFKLAGIGESSLSDLVIGDVSKLLKNGISMAYLPGGQGQMIRISCIKETRKAAEREVDPLLKHIREKAKEYIFSEEADDTISAAIGRLLREQELTLSTAESCTGGLIASLITDISGSSDYFEGTIVSYSNDVKIKVLGVDKEALIEYGAVSKQVALQMAKGVAEQLETDIGISTTGIAGPTGGSPEKPVGTIWIGYWSKNEHFGIKTQLTKDRILNKERASAIALDVIRRRLSDIETLPYALKPIYP